MANVGPLEVLVVLIIALVIFGPKRIPELGRSLGQGYRGFKDSLAGEDEESVEPKAIEPAAAQSEERSSEEPRRE